jgi:hypothetical protein
MALDLNGNKLFSTSVGPRGEVIRQIVTNNLILHLDAGNKNSYSGSGTLWTDLTGNGYNGTLNNGASFNSSNGGSIVLDGTDDDISFGNILSINKFTISLWVYPGTTQTTYADIIDNNHRGGTSFVLQQDVSNTNVYGFGVGDGASGSSTGNFTLTANQWVNLTFTYDLGVRGYRNGVIFATGAAAGNPNYTGIETLRLGEWGGGGRNWNGRYGSFLAYNRALSATEVFQNYSVQKSRFGL